MLTPLVPGETYQMVDQTFLSPVEPGLHPMTAHVMSCGASGVHFREIEVYGYVEDGQLRHLELSNGDVVHWWSWDRDRDAKRLQLREERGHGPAL